MLLLALVSLPFFIAFHVIASTIAQLLSLSPLYVWIAYYAASEFVERRRWSHSPRLRACAAVAYVGRVLIGASFSRDSVERLRALDPRRQRLFVNEPHGVAVTHLAFGFAAHGGALPDALAERTLVVAHVVFKYIPIVRNLYAAFGVIDNSSATINRALNDGYSLALVPSGLSGKWTSLMAPSPVDESDEHCVTVLVRRRDSIGCFVYAARRALSIVPVLSPEEDHVYRRFLREFRHPYTVLALGRWFILPYAPIEWRVGAEIAPSDRAHTLATRTYNALSSIGEPHYKVVVLRDGAPLSK